MWEKEQIRGIPSEKEQRIRPYNHILVDAETLTPKKFRNFYF